MEYDNTINRPLYAGMHDQAGVRPSSGAATRESQKALENQHVSVPSGVAAPGDGRTPLSPILRPWQYQIRGRRLNLTRMRRAGPPSSRGGPTQPFGLG